MPLGCSILVLKVVNRVSSQGVFSQMLQLPSKTTSFIARASFTFLSIAALALTLPANAQTPTGRVVGTITDQSGGFVAGAKVAVTNVETGFRTERTTGSDGTYQALELP